MPDGGGEHMQFTPGLETAHEFREALGRYATGVTVVTCNSLLGRLGITASSFSSVSLDPPLVLWSPARASKRFSAFEQADHFSIHVLSEHQREIGNGFARTADAFETGEWIDSDEGVPTLKDCLARFDCQRHAIHDGGDHAIIVGRVTNAVVRQGNPLIFAKGSYGGFRNQN